MVIVKNESLISSAGIHVTFVEFLAIVGPSEFTNVILSSQYVSQYEIMINDRTFYVL